VSNISRQVAAGTMCGSAVTYKSYYLRATRQKRWQ